MEEIILGETEIKISGKLIDIIVYRTEDGNLAWRLKDFSHFEKGGFLEHGTCVEGFNDEILIYKYMP